MSFLLTPDNAALFREVQKLACERDPAVSWEDIARHCGLDATDVPALLDWFIRFKLPSRPAILPMGESVRFIRDPALRAEHARLRRREASLVTVATEAPDQLARVQRRITSIERAK